MEQLVLVTELNQTKGKRGNNSEHVGNYKGHISNMDPGSFLNNVYQEEVAEP